MPADEASQKALETIRKKAREIGNVRHTTVGAARQRRLVEQSLDENSPSASRMSR